MNADQPVPVLDAAPDGAFESAPEPTTDSTPRPTASAPSYDVVVIGGGAGGLSTALTLGRALRRVLVVDSGQPRNAPAAGAHNYLTRDGVPPLELLRLAGPTWRSTATRS